MKAIPLAAQVYINALSNCKIHVKLCTKKWRHFCTRPANLVSYLPSYVCTLLACSSVRVPGLSKQSEMKQKKCYLNLLSTHCRISIIPSLNKITSAFCFWCSCRLHFVSLSCLVTSGLLCSRRNPGCTKICRIMTPPKHSFKR